MQFIIGKPFKDNVENLDNSSYTNTKKIFCNTKYLMISSRTDLSDLVVVYNIKNSEEILPTLDFNRNFKYRFMNLVFKYLISFSF